MIANDPTDSAGAAAAAAPPERAATPSPPVAAADPEGRHALIAEAAYFIAEARGFGPGCELDDWLAAEREIDRRGSATQV
jgi:hypothetical protein